MKPGRLRWFGADRRVPREGNQVVLLQSGTEYFPALLAAIASARSEVLVETYIYADDATGHRVAAALARAARRGVVVRLLIDGFGTREFPPKIERVLRASGVEVRIYAPLPRLLSLDRERLRRLHRKLACIDGEIAFIGGINILDDLWDPNHGALEHPRLDYAVKARGPVCVDVHETMTRLWGQLVARDRLRPFGSRASRALRPVALRPGWRQRDPRRERLMPDDALSQATVPQPDGLPATLVLRDNLGSRRAIERAYLKALGNARREVLIANAYFFPGHRFSRALRLAAARGVKVRLLLQGRIEYRLPHYASQALYDELLAAGVEIVEYHRSFLHAKVAVIDDWATVGSSNIDPFSLLLSREANLMVMDAGFARALRERLLESIDQGGRPLAVAQHAARSWTQRLMNRIAYWVLRFGVLVSGTRSRY